MNLCYKNNEKKFWINVKTIGLKNLHGHIHHLLSHNLINHCYLYFLCTGKALAFSQAFTPNPVLFKFSISLTIFHSKCYQFLLGLYTQCFMSTHSLLPFNYYSLRWSLPGVCFPPVSLGRKLQTPDLKSDIP